MSPQLRPDELFSDDSSFYGDEEETAEWEEVAAAYNPEHYWTHTHPDLLSTIQYEATRPPPQTTATKGAKMTSSPMDIDSTGPPLPLPRNRPGKHELVSEFLARLPPSRTQTSTIGPWIYVSNPHRREPTEDIATFTAQGTRVLREFENEKAQLTLQHDRSGSGSTAGLSRKLGPLRQSLERCIFSLARETGVVTGKWMLFITPDRVDHYWGVVATATARGELGLGAKVAADDGGERARLIAVYTNDYEDREDVKRVLRRLMELNVVRRGERPIYYKCDALTHLEIMSNNPYGLKPTLFSSADVLAGKV